MFDLQLIGHICKDVILRNNEQHTTLGAMANLWEACENIDSSLNVKLCPLYYGKALIFEDNSSGQRYSKANLNHQPLSYKIIDSSWNHVFYINHLPDLNFLSDLKGIVSADICAGGKIDYDFLKYIDYLFIADEDLQIGLEDLISYTKGYVICHSSDGSIVSNGTYYKKHNIEKIENLNVLGAGDYFAISFIINMLKNHNLDASISQAHKDATNFLLNKK